MPGSACIRSVVEYFVGDHVGFVGFVAGRTLAGVCVGLVVVVVVVAVVDVVVLLIEVFVVVGDTVSVVVVLLMTTSTVVGSGLDVAGSEMFINQYIFQRFPRDIYEQDMQCFTNAILFHNLTICWII